MDVPALPGSPICGVNRLGGCVYGVREGGGVAGEPAEFDAFVLARGPALLRFAYVLTGDRGLAEDLVQEALVKVYRRWDRVWAADQPEAYVRRIVVNEATNWRRRRRNSETPAPVPEGVVGDGVETLAERDLVMRALGRLPSRQRAVLALRFYEDLSEAQIAEVLGCAPGTVRSLTNRALTALRAQPGLSHTLDQTPSISGEKP